MASVRGFDALPRLCYDQGMATPPKPYPGRFATAVALGVMVGLVVGGLVKVMRPGDPAEVEDKGGIWSQRGSLFGGAPAAKQGEEPLSPPTGSAAWRYAEALRTGDTETVIDLTLWMQERLRRVQAGAGDPAAMAAARRALAEDALARNVAENQLRAEGVLDQYVFSPSSTVEFVGEDTGRTDLERPAAERLWFRVTYPSRDAALRDATGLPIRSLRVGVNVSPDGYILKANVLGNLDIDPESIRYDWGADAPGE